MEHTTKKELDDDLEDVVKKIKNADWSSIVAYESDSIHRMHLHTVIYITGKPPVFKNLQIPGRQRFFKKISNSVNGYIYCSKQKQDPWAIINRFENNKDYWDRIRLDKPKRTGIKISDLLD